MLMTRRLASLSSSLPELHPVLQRVYAARGISSKDELSLSLKDLLPFHKLKGIDAAVAVLESGPRRAAAYSDCG